MEIPCKVEAALEILVGKWKPVILFHLLNNKTMRFSQIKKAIPAITQKMLTSQLRELEHHDIIHREVYAQIPPKVEYSITEYGQSLVPILTLMNEWGTAHLVHLEKLYGEQTILPTQK